jgi:hypothetical protein
LSPETRSPERAPTLLARLGWFVLLWAAGVGAVGAVALLVRAALR